MGSKFVPSFLFSANYVAFLSGLSLRPKHCFVQRERIFAALLGCEMSLRHSSSNHGRLGFFGTGAEGEQYLKCILLAVIKPECNDEYAVVGFCSATTLLVNGRVLRVLF